MTVNLPHPMTFLAPMALVLEDSGIKSRICPGEKIRPDWKTVPSTGMYKIDGTTNKKLDGGSVSPTASP
jgi:hypothetical protein